MRILISCQNLRLGGKPRGVQRCATQFAYALSNRRDVALDIALRFQADYGNLYTYSIPYKMVYKAAPLAEGETRIADPAPSGNEPPAEAEETKEPDAIAAPPPNLVQPSEKLPLTGRVMIWAADSLPTVKKIGKAVDFTGGIRRRFLGYRSIQHQELVPPLPVCETRPAAPRKEESGTGALEVPDDIRMIEEKYPHGSWFDVDHYDAILSFEFAESMWEQPLMLSRAKKICLVHDMIFARMEQAADNWLYKGVNLFESTMHRSDGLICNSEATLRDLRRFLPTLARPATVTLLGKSDTGSGNLVFNGDSVREGMGRRDDQFVIFMLGDMDRRKNVRNALAALPLLAKRLPGKKVVLNMVGNTANMERVETVLRAARESATVNLMGYVSDTDVERLYRESDVYLFPSLWEGFGLPILEAMAHGTPVVTSEVASMPEVGGDLAVYVDPCDPANIAEGVLKVAAMTPEDRSDFARKAKDWSEKFTWDDTAEKTVNFIESLRKT